MSCEIYEPPYFRLQNMTQERTRVVAGNSKEGSNQLTRGATTLVDYGEIVCGVVGSLNFNGLGCMLKKQYG